MTDDNRPNRSLVKQVLKEDNYTCQNCRKKADSKSTDLNVHHIVPLKNGGSNNKSNLTTLCSECHSAIHNDTNAPTAHTNTTKRKNKLQELKHVLDEGNGTALVLLSILFVILFLSDKYPVMSIAGIALVSVAFSLSTGLIGVPFGFFICCSVFVLIIQDAKRQHKNKQKL